VKSTNFAIKQLPFDRAAAARLDFGSGTANLASGEKAEGRWGGHYAMIAHSGLAIAGVPTPSFALSREESKKKLAFDEEITFE